MQWNFILYTSMLFMLLLNGEVSGQEAPFELPVQLVGFPFIVLSVRLTNFLKKLSYSVSPATYRARTRRELLLEPSVEPFDAQEVEKYIVGEFGARACVFERVCAHYAARAQTHPRPQLDWPDVFRQSGHQPAMSQPDFRHTTQRTPLKMFEKYRSGEMADFFCQYKRSPDQAKEYYLLSVFLGDIVGSPQLCHQLGKRRSCDALQLGAV